jgi:asparaginyl-tRNA synthetase
MKQRLRPRQGLLLRPDVPSREVQNAPHLTEFWMVEPEVAFATLDDVMTLAEEFITSVVQSVLKNRRAELQALERDVGKLEQITPPFPRLPYDEAVMNLQSAGSEIQWGSDLGGGDETILSQQFDRPVMVHRYPAQVKAFIWEPDPARPELALCVDVLAPEGYGEIIGGAPTASSLELLNQRIQQHHLPPEAFDWYLTSESTELFPTPGSEWELNAP